MLGHLDVSVVEGRNLCVKHDARPYLLLQIGNNQAKTGPVKTGGKWAEDVRLDVPSEDASLTVALWDDSVNLAVGKASFPISDLISIGTALQWLTIKDPNGKDAGQIYLLCRFTKAASFNEIKRENGFTRKNEAESDVSSSTSSLASHEHVCNDEDDDKPNKRNKKGGYNKYLVLAGAAITFLLAAFAVSSHQKRRSKYYEVKEGDTLCSIADSYGLSPDDVFEANMNVTNDPDRIYPGDRIYIP